MFVLMINYSIYVWCVYDMFLACDGALFVALHVLLLFSVNPILPKQGSLTFQGVSFLEVHKVHKSPAGGVGSSSQVTPTGRCWLVCRTCVVILAFCHSIRASFVKTG